MQDKKLLKAFKVQGRRLRFYRFFRWTDIAKIRLGIEGCLEFLSIDLSRRKSGNRYVGCGNSASAERTAGIQRD